jgi:predicted SAM-dependent methyltransferase
MAILRLDPGRARKVFSSRAVDALEVRLALAFKTPKEAGRLAGDDFEEALADGSTDPEAVRQALRRLTEEGVLVPPAEDAGAEAVFSGELASLARQLDGIAGDLSAMGDWALRNVRAGGEDPARLLASVRERLAGLRRELRGAREAFLGEQLQGAVRAPEGDLRLHLGCGDSRAPGWTNIDLTGGDVRLNLSWPLPFDDGSVSWVYSAHTLEHLDFHTAAPRLLKEIHRVLAPGGMARLAVPDLEAYAREYAAGNDAFFREYDRQRPEFGRAAGYRTNLSKVMLMAGSAARSGWFFEHKMGYDFDTLADLLRRAGFGAVERSRFGESAHEPLRGMDQTSGPAKLAYGDVANTLFIEATKEI